MLVLDYFSISRRVNVLINVTTTMVKLFFLISKIINFAITVQKGVNLVVLGIMDSFALAALMGTIWRI